MQPVAREYDRPVGNQATVDMPAPGGLPLEWSPDGRYIYTLFSDHGRVHLARVAVAEGMVEPLTRGERVVYAAALDAARQRAALAVAEPLNPADIYLLDLAGVHEERLSRHNRELLEQLDLSEPRRFTARAPGGPPVDGWVMEPVGREPGGRYPAVLEITVDRWRCTGPVFL